MDGGAAPRPPPDTGCHGGRETMREAARAAGKSTTMDRLAADYPRGPHDQPQSMCPAFGSLRVGLRMRRVATILYATDTGNSKELAGMLSTAVSAK
ncbi:MAG: hypothetical protein ACK4ST_14320, partial [Elioraea tepidiphila]